MSLKDVALAIDRIQNLGTPSKSIINLATCFDVLPEPMNLPFG
jgi:hypothetical protein